MSGVSSETRPAEGHDGRLASYLGGAPLSDLAGREAEGDPAPEPEAKGLRAVLLRHEWPAFLLLMLVGLIERIFWVSQDGRLRPAVSETQQVAACFARTGMLCDAYFAGQGPTAHVNPVFPSLVGYLYRALGEGSLATEIVLTAVSLSVLCATLLALYLAFRRLAVPIEWRFAALATALLLPMNFKWETVSMRLFEGGLSAALLAVSLLLVLRLDGRRALLRPRDYALPAGLIGFLALINPPAALGAYGAFGILTLKRAPLRRWLGVTLVMTLGLAVFITPWGLRNERVFGRLILARSNFPLEHALGFHPAAVSPQDPAAVFRVRAHEIHPYSNDPVAPGRLEVARIGEIAYMDKLAAQARAWERTHPAETFQLAVRHLREFWLPPRWSWSIFGNDAPLVAPRQALVWATALAAFAAVIWRLAEAPLGRGLYLACVLIIPSLPYALVQPVQRYRYLVVLLTFFLAADFAARIAALVARRRDAERREPSPQAG